MPDKFDPEYPFATVIDAEGYRVDFVQVSYDWQGNTVPEYYEMQEGESLDFDDWQTANDLATIWTQVKKDDKTWVGAGAEIPQQEQQEHMEQLGQPTDLMERIVELEDTVERLTEVVEGLVESNR